MRVTKIQIANFKGLQAAEFAPGKFACLVGENNAGKSSVLQAIVYALNRPSQIPADLFYDPNEPIEFRLFFSEVTETHLARLAPEHRSKITEIVNDGAMTLLARYRANEKVEIKVEKLVPNEERYNSEFISQAFAGKRPPAVRQALIENFPEFEANAPVDLNITTAKSYVSGCISQLPRDQFTLADSPLPSGISSSISALLPEPIYIPAVKNLADDLKTSQSTSFGRLLGLLLEDMTPDLASVNEALESLNRLFNRTYDNAGEANDGRHAKVRELEQTMEGFLKENFPNAKVELNIPPPELKAILNTAQIYIDDGSRDLIDNKGDGIKRSFTFALLQSYVARLQAAKENLEETNEARPLIFLFEEPELYLHPKSQRTLFNTLASISNSHQVVLTTHSPLFFAPDVTASFVRIAKKTAHPKPVGVLHHVDFDLDTSNAEAFKMARFENADAAFFSQRVVLFEGESDDTFFKHVAKCLNSAWNFDAKNVAMVRVSGKGNFARFRKFFEAFGIEVKIVADLDAFFDGFAHLGVGDQVNESRNKALQKIDARIDTLQMKAEPATRQIKDRLNGDSWKTRYNAAKGALQKLQETQKIDSDTLSLIEDLFIWEKDIARVKVCREDAEAKCALIETLDKMRELGVCVLAEGAIEDYYPDSAPAKGSKPERALGACSQVKDLEAALKLSKSLDKDRKPELVEICEALFIDIQ